MALPSSPGIVPSKLEGLGVGLRFLIRFRVQVKDSVCSKMKLVIGLV